MKWRWPWRWRRLSAEQRALIAELRAAKWTVRTEWSDGRWEEHEIDDTPLPWTERFRRRWAYWSYVLRPKPVWWFRRWRTTRQLAAMEKAGTYRPNAESLRRRERDRQKTQRLIRRIKAALLWLIAAILLAGLIASRLR